MTRRENLLSAKELADYLGVPLGTIYNWNYHDSGPRRYRIGKHVRYRFSDVEKWLNQREMGGT